jgi:hypothetical protein
LSLKELLKKDFDLNLNIAGGGGQSRQDPIILLDQDPLASWTTTARILGALGKGRRILWRSIGHAPLVHGERLLMQVKIETKQVTAVELITQVENYYFDMTVSGHSKDPLCPIVYWDQRTHLWLPYEIGWLHFEHVIDNELVAPGLGQTIAYSAPCMKATIYVYGGQLSTIPPDLDAPIARNELDRAVSHFRTRCPTATEIGELSKRKKLLIRRFLTDLDLSVVALGVSGGTFVKVRVTCTRDYPFAELALRSIAAFDDLLLEQDPAIHP